VTLQSHPEIAVCPRCLDWLAMKREKQLKARGGWRAIAFDPIFTIADLPRSTDHYAKMGFEIHPYNETNAFAHRDRDLTIHFRVSDTGPTKSQLYIHCGDADELADEWRKAGLEINGPQDYDYGKREGSHIDPDVNLIRFGSPPRSRD
jgi:hypothetical protein